MSTVKTVITTSGRPDMQTHKRAKEAADVLGYPVVNRNKQSVMQIQERYKADCLVAGKNRFEYYATGMNQPFFFHPNSAAFRLKRLANAESDPLIEATQLKKGMSFLDCTLGLASDSIVASFLVGDSGLITGIEINQDIAFITGCGLRSFPSKSPELTSAMMRINVVSMDAIDYLRSQPDASWDIVYVDPMFSAPIEEASNFTPLRKVGAQNGLTEEWVEEALRVCQQRVVMKDRFDSPIFKRFGFKRYNRPNTKFHFGSLEKDAVTP